MSFETDLAKFKKQVDSFSIAGAAGNFHTGFSIGDDTRGAGAGVRTSAPNTPEEVLTQLEQSFKNFTIRGGHDVSVAGSLVAGGFAISAKGGVPQEGVATGPPPPPPPADCYGPPTISIDLSGITYLCDCIAPIGLTWQSATVVGDPGFDGTFTLTRDDSLASSGLVSYDNTWDTTTVDWFTDDATCASTAQDTATAQVHVFCIAPDSTFSAFYAPGVYCTCIVFGTDFLVYAFFQYSATEDTSFTNVTTCNTFDPGVSPAGSAPYVGIGTGGTATISV